MNKSGLKINVISGLVISVWSGVVSILVVPVYFSMLGSASFGLIIFSSTLLGLFAILDLGFATSINREVAQATTRGDTSSLRDLLHSLAVVYWLIAIAAGSATFIAAEPVAMTFLTSISVDAETVTNAVRLMAIMIALRLPAGLYMGVLLGSQQIVTANIVTFIITTLTTVGAFVVLKVTHGGILMFLTWQVGISVFNILLLMGTAWRALPGERRPRLSSKELARIWHFSSMIALTTVIGAVTLQLDKLVLARFATLEIVGQYGLAGFASRALLLLVAPVFAALYPRLSELHARGDEESLTSFYRTATRALTCILTAASVFFLLNAQDVLALWTGSNMTALKLRQVAPILLIGTALNGLMYIPHTVQLAYGNARIAFWNNVAMFAFLAPAVFLLVPRYGMIGAAIGWLGANIINVLVGTWLTHRDILPGLTVRWLLFDVGVPIGATCVLPLVGALGSDGGNTIIVRLVIGAVLSGIGLAIGLATIPAIRTAVRYRGRMGVATGPGLVGPGSP